MKKRLLLVLPLAFLVGCTPSTPSSGSDTQKDENFLHGKGAPYASIGDNFSHYYDEDTKYVWEKNNGEWINQFTIGSEALFTEENNSSSLLRNSNSVSDLQKLKNALAMSFYSTNATCHMIPHLPEGTGWDLLVNYDGRNIKADSTTPGALEKPYYIKMGLDGKASLYKQGQYIEIDNDNLYCLLPHPTIESIAFNNYLLYDDELGMQTSIIAGHLSKATYDSETKQYSIENIRISHSEMTSYYFHTPTADTMVINFSFKLSDDESYVSQAFLKIVSSEAVPSFNDFEWEYNFTNVHSTTIEMP